MVHSWIQLKTDYIEGSKNEDNLILKFELQIRRLHELSVVFSYDVIHDFAFSLKTYAKNVDVKNKQDREIIQTHIDVIFLAYKRQVTVKDKAAVSALWDTLAKAY